MLQFAEGKLYLGEGGFYSCRNRNGSQFWKGPLEVKKYALEDCYTQWGMGKKLGSEEMFGVVIVL